MDLSDRINIYKNVSSKNREKENFYACTMSQKNSCNYTDEFIFLAKSIPNIEIYFKDYQIKLIKLFINYKSVADIARLINKEYSSVHSALFGNGINNEQGIFGKLKYIYSNIIKFNIIDNSESDFGNVIDKRNDVIKQLKDKKSITHLENQLLKYINEVTDWKDYLNTYQIEIVELFLKYKSYIKVNSISNKNSFTTLFGHSRIHHGGVYKILEKQYYNK